MKFIALLAVVFAFNANAIITAPYSNQIDNLGTVVIKDKSFIKVKNGESVSVARGKVVVFSTSADDGATIATSATAGAPYACVMDETCASGAQCLCQVKGYHDAVYFDAAAGGASAGEAGFVSDLVAGGYVKSNDSVAAGHVPVGMFLDTISATGTVEMVIGF